MSIQSSNNDRLPEQSATGNAVFTLTAISLALYITAGVLLLGFPTMVDLSFGLQFNNIWMGILNFVCVGGHVISAIYMKRRQYYIGSTLLIIISILGFIIGGGLLVGPLWGVIAASIGFICDPLERKLYERQINQR